MSNATNGVEVEDRDPFGTIAAVHDAYSFSAFSGYAPKTGYTKFGTALVSDTGLSDNVADPQFARRLYFGHDRPDEYDSAAYGLAFQGVRAVDENTGQWVSPDKFGGYSDSPMSQMPYVWNNNNGLAYQDPSGYCGKATVQGFGAHGQQSTPETWDNGPCIDDMFDAMTESAIGDILWAAMGPGSFDLPDLGGLWNKAQNLWKKRCVRDALRSGALSVGVDAIGLVPEAGGISRVVGHQLGFVGAVADRQGGNLVRAVGGSSSAGLAAVGLANGDSGGAASTSINVGLTVVGFIPGAGQVTAVLSMAWDAYQTGKAITNCR